MLLRALRIDILKKVEIILLIQQGNFMDTLKLKTQIEKELHGFVNNIKEHMVDYTILYIRRNMAHIDRDQLTQILDVVRNGIEDSYFTQIDHFMTKMNVTIEENVEAETTSKAKKSKNSESARV